MALSDSKLKSLLNKKQSKRFDIADRDSLSVRVSEFGTITFNIVTVTMINHLALHWDVILIFH